MITSALLYIIFGILSVVLLIFPASEGLPSQITAGISFFIEQADKWNSFVPVYNELLVLVAVLSFEGGILIYKLGNWAYNKFRGSSGG